MKVHQTGIQNLLIIEPKVFSDERGYFFEAFNKKLFHEHELHYDFVQDNQSKSAYGVIRGLHFQTSPFAQTKLVRVLEGAIIDVAIDIRTNSETFGKHYKILLSAENHKQFLIPKGFAHGFSVITANAVVMYKCDEFYNKEAERGFRFDDPYWKIDWEIDQQDAIISEKDLIHPAFSVNQQYF